MSNTLLSITSNIQMQNFSWILILFEVLEHTECLSVLPKYSSTHISPFPRLLGRLQFILGNSPSILDRSSIDLTDKRSTRAKSPWIHHLRLRVISTVHRLAFLPKILLRETRILSDSATAPNNSFIGFTLSTSLRIEDAPSIILNT